MSPLSLESLLPSYIRSFEPYVPSRPDAELMRLYGCSRLFRLNNNENALGPPPAAQEEIRRFVRPGPPCIQRRFILSAAKAGGAFGKDPERFLSETAQRVIASPSRHSARPATTSSRRTDVCRFEWVASFSGLEARLVPLRDYAHRRTGDAERMDGGPKSSSSAIPQYDGNLWRREQLTAGPGAVDEGDRPSSMRHTASSSSGRIIRRMSLLEKFPISSCSGPFPRCTGLAGLRLGYWPGRAVVDALAALCVYSVNVGPGSGRARGRRNNILKSRRWLGERLI
jgi:histidinol-phosphate aminotransferase